MVSSSLVASPVGRGADASFPSQLDPVSLSLASEVSAVALADHVSLNLAVEVPASPAGTASWAPQLVPLSLSSFIA